MQRQARRNLVVFAGAARPATLLAVAATHRSLKRRRILMNLPLLGNAAPTSARKKAPRKAHVPGGQRTQSPFRERLDAITLACGRTHGKVALGGSKRMPRVGECIVADGGPPCQRQPLRGQLFPKRGVDPSTWFVGLRSDRRGWLIDSLPRRQSLLCSIFPTTTCPAGPSFPRRGAAEYGTGLLRVNTDFSIFRFAAPATRQSSSV
jgi:hypothetical protein